MFVKIIGSTQKTIEPYVCFNPFVHSLSSQKKYLCKLLMKIEGGEGGFLGGFFPSKNSDN